MKPKPSSVSVIVLSCIALLFAAAAVATALLDTEPRRRIVMFVIAFAAVYVAVRQVIAWFKA